MGTIADQMTGAGETRAGGTLPDLRRHERADALLPARPLDVRPGRYRWRLRASRSKRAATDTRAVSVPATSPGRGGRARRLDRRTRTGAVARPRVMSSVRLPTSTS